MLSYVSTRPYTAQLGRVKLTQPMPLQAVTNRLRYQTSNFMPNCLAYNTINETVIRLVVSIVYPLYPHVYKNKHF